VKTFLVPVAAIFLICATLHGATTNLLPVADTTLFEVSPDNNLGLSTLAIGSVAASGAGARGRGLLRFDLSGIPTNAVIDSATFTFKVVQVPLGGVSSSFRLHRFLKPWVEGRGGGTTGSLALPTETTWNSQFHGTALWSPPGTGSGVDYTATESGTVDVDEFATYTVQDSGLAADVQSWVSDATANHGWIMISSGEGTQRTARRVASRESPGEGPSLALQYTVPPSDPSPQIASAAVTNGQFELRFTVPSTYCYEVQFRDSLINGLWAPLTNICAEAGDSSAVAADSLSSQHRFYRLFISDRVR
jgi:hypothetical protein